LQGIFLIITAPVLAANLLADGPYVLLDLRVRQGRHSLTVPLAGHAVGGPTAAPPSATITLTSPPAG
jgi:hypothetical protein